MALRRIYRRETEIARLRERLERFGFPRLRMLLIISLTGAAGFVASFGMLQAGVDSMPLRYALALLVAYAVFLLLLWAWLRNSDESGLDHLDLPDPPGSRGGGSAYDAGAGGHDGVSGHDAGALDGLGAADEYAIPLLLIVAAAAILFASLWIVVSAPTLFAELLVDGVLSARLYKRLRGLETRHWLETAVRRTFWPFAGTLAVLVAFGFAAQHYVPAARSLGDLLP